jgi:hypothetical protein
MSDDDSVIRRIIILAGAASAAFAVDAHAQLPPPDPHWVQTGKVSPPPGHDGQVWTYTSFLDSAHITLEPNGQVTAWTRDTNERTAPQPYRSETVRKVTYDCGGHKEHWIESYTWTNSGAQPVLGNSDDRFLTVDPASPDGGKLAEACRQMHH